MMHKPLEYQKMASVEDEMWWFRILHHQVYKALQTYFPSKNIRIMDAGCGTGGLLTYLKKKGYEDSYGFDLSEYGLQFCRQRGLEVFAGSVTQVEQFANENSLDVIICNDVFCYLNTKDRIATVRKFEKLLTANGLLIMNNASLKAYRGNHDIAVGVTHRFSKEEIIQLFKGTSFSLLKARYWPFFLSPLIFILRKWQRLKPTLKSSAETSSDVRLPPTWLNWTFKKITDLEMILLDHTFTGSSFFIVVQKDGK